MAWYHPLHPSTLRESCLLPPFTRRNALFELDSRIATAITLSIPYLKRVITLRPAQSPFELDSTLHPLHPSTLRESCLLPPFIRRNAPFELDSRIAGWPWPGITLSIPLP